MMTERPMVQVSENVPAAVVARLAVHSVCLVPPRRIAFCVMVPGPLTATELFRLIVDAPMVRVVLTTFTVGALDPPSPNVAVTLAAALIFTVHVAAAPEHPAPLQLLSDDPSAGVALSTTSEPMAKSAEQVDPQEIPAGDEVTTPLPSPARVTVSFANVAALLAAWTM